MKKTIKTIILGAFGVLFAASALAQTPKDVTEITLMKAGRKSAGIVIGDGTAKAVRVFGQPSSISDFYSEISDETMKVYNYGKNKLYFSKGLLQSFELNQAGIEVGRINGDSFHVGERIVTSANKRSFHSYVLTANPDGTTRGIVGKTISNTYLKKGSVKFDSLMQLVFDSKDNLVNVAVIEP